MSFMPSIKIRKQLDTGGSCLLSTREAEIRRITVQSQPWANSSQDLISKITNTHSCNPSYLGGRDQEDCSLTPAQANSLGEPILKNPLQKRADGVAQGVGPEFKPQYHQKKKENIQHNPEIRITTHLKLYILLPKAETLEITSESSLSFPLLLKSRCWILRNASTGCQWFMPIIIATQEAEIRGNQCLNPAQVNSL
jgi:hypothetical protein